MGSPCPTHVIQSCIAASLHRRAPPEIEDIGHWPQEHSSSFAANRRIECSPHISAMSASAINASHHSSASRSRSESAAISRYPASRASSSTMSGSLDRCRLALRQELGLEFIQDLANVGAQGIVQLLFLSDLLPQSRIGGVQEVVEPQLERPAVFDGEVVQITVGPGENNNHLFLHRPGLVLVLLQNLGQAA